MRSGKIVLFLILPVILFISISFFKDAGGPYYLNYYDPGYVYLVNSINLMHFDAIGHSDHPGTTVQIFGAVILKILFIGKSNQQILDTIFSDPEFYLNIINKSLLGINCIALFLLGLYVYRKTSDLYQSILIQLTPFISLEIFYGLVIVAPENFLILSSLLIIGGLFYYIYDKDSDKHMTGLSIYFALVCGFGAESKLNFIPVCLLPLILLKGFKNKSIFAAGTIIVFLILFLPALSKLSYFSDWAGDLAFKSGVHGQTDLSQFSILKLIENLFLIFSKDFFFTIIYLLILTSLIFGIFVKPDIADADQKYVYKNERKTLLAVLAVITFQILVVAKNYMPYAQYYIIPSLMFTITCLTLLISISLKSFSKLINFNTVKIYITVLICVLLFSIFEYFTSVNDSIKFRDEAVKVNNIINEYKKSVTVIPSVGTANEDCALAINLMYGYSGVMEPVYRKKFSEISTSQVFHDFWKNKFFSISDKIDIGEYISSKDKIVVQLMSVTTIEMIVQLLKEDYNIDVKDWKLIMKNNNQESVYEIYLK